MPSTTSRKESLPLREDRGAECARRLSSLLQILIVSVAAFVWLCGSPGFVSEVQAGGGGIGGGSPKTTYVYDELGRLVQVVSSDLGISATYHYDAVGNLLSITLNTPTGGLSGGPAVVISEIYPDEGPIGTQVTISGSGFSPTAGSDSVKFNGTTATINSATANSIVATVPAGATSGAVTVTSPNGSATSGEAFTVTAGGPSPPSITGFTPTIGTAGTPITISGANFNADPNGDAVRLGGIDAPVTSASATTINTSVPSLATTGPISVTTSAGTVTTTTDFYVPPGGYTPSSISVTGQMSVGGPPVTANFTSGTSNAIYAFQGSEGQQVSLGISNSNLNEPVVTILNPDGSTQSSTLVIWSGAFIDVQTLPATGTYVVFVNSGNSPGHITLQLFDATTKTGSIAVGGASVTSSVNLGQDVSLTFSGTAGQQVSLGISGSSLSDPVVSILNPDGSTLTSTTVIWSGAFIDAQTLPTTGTYTVLVDTGSTGGSITLQLFNATTETGSIAVGGASVTSSVNLGQDVSLTFSATAGQQVSLGISGSSLSDPVVSILKPDGSTLTSTTVIWSGAFIDAQTLPTTGTYTVLVDTGSTGGSITLQLFDATTKTGPIAVGGASVTNSVNLGQDIKLTFSGTAGQQVSLGISGSNLNDPVVSILNPDGSTLSATTVIWSGAFIDVQTLPSTGTYTVFVDTGGTGGSITLQLFDATNESGPISVGGAPVTSNVNLGQDVFLTFNGTAGQQVSLGISNSNLNNPVVSILKPDGSTLASTTVIWSGAFIDVQTLPTTGTYTVFVDTGGTGGTITNQLFDASAINGSITVGGNVPETVNPGQDVYLTFSGTAGQQVSLIGYNSNLNDPVIGILKPDLSTLASTTIIFSSAFVDVMTLPTTGTYTVFADTGQAAGNITLALIDATTVTGPITVNGSAPVENVNAGQDVKLTFSGTAGQKVTFSGSGSNLNDPVLSILNPDGSTLSSCTIIFSSCSTGSQTLGSTGTYTAYIDTNSASGTITLSVTSP